MTTTPPSAPSRSATPPIVAALTLAVSLGLTALVWRGAATALDQKLQDNFDYRIRDAERRVADRLKHYESALRAAGALFAASDQVDRGAFGRFVASLDLRRSAPGVQAMGFQRLVPAAAREAHVEAMRREGLPDYQVRPDGPRALLAPVVFVEPFTGGNPAVLGFDPLSEPMRRAALERARDGATTSLSAKVFLLQDSGAAPTPGALIYLPVYRAGTAPATVEARREALLGWLYLAFRVNDLMEGLLGERGGDLEVELYDGQAPSAESQLYDSNGAPFALRPTGARFESARPLAVAGHAWTLALRSTGGFEQRLGSEQPRLVAAAGVVMSVLLALIALLLANSRARVQEALRRSESLYQLLARSFPNGVVGLFDRDLRYRLVDGASTLTADPHSWEGRTLPELAPPGLLQRLEPAYRAALAGSSVRVEVEVEGRTLEVLLQPVHDPSGAVAMGMLVTQDVTERKRAEEEVRALQAKLAQASRVAAVGTLVAGVAHEINNPLAVQLSDQEMALELLGGLRERFQGGAPLEPAAVLDRLAEAVEVVEEAQAAGQRVARIVRDMREVARPDFPRTRVKLSEVVDGALRALQGAGGQAEPVAVRDLAAPDVLAAAKQIEQVVVNLVTNAEKASGGRRAGILIQLGPGSPGMARLDVSDHGTGIDPSIADRIFDPFFTTRPAGEGRGPGLGLAICQAIVLAHGGTLAVESEAGKGSTFRMELPAAPAEG